MGESQELYTSVNYIKHKVEAIEKIELLNLRSNKALYEEYVSILKADSLLLKIYKEIDGEKTQKTISDIVNTTEMSVSNKVKKLVELGLVEIKEIIGSKKIYMHSIAEKAFKLTRI